MHEFVSFLLIRNDLLLDRELLLQAGHLTVELIELRLILAKLLVLILQLRERGLGSVVFIHLALYQAEISGKDDQETDCGDDPELHAFRHFTESGHTYRPVLRFLRRWGRGRLVDFTRDHET